MSTTSTTVVLSESDHGGRTYFTPAHQNRKGHTSNGNVNNIATATIMKNKQSSTAAVPHESLKIHKEDEEGSNLEEQTRQLLDKTFSKLAREYEALKALLHGSGNTSATPPVETNAPAVSTSSFTVTNTAANKTTTTTSSPLQQQQQQMRGDINNKNSNSLNTSSPPSHVLILPHERAESIATEQWQRHNEFLLTAAEPHDPLFAHLGRVALFCQLRAGGAEYGEHNNNNDEAKNSTEEENFGDELGGGGGGRKSEGEEVMTAVEMIRQDLDDRCKLLRHLLQVLEEKSVDVCGSAALAVDEDVLSISMMKEQEKQSRKMGINTAKTALGGGPSQMSLSQVCAFQEKRDTKNEYTTRQGQKQQEVSTSTPKNEEEFFPITCTDGDAHFGGSVKPTDANAEKEARRINGSSFFSSLALLSSSLLGGWTQTKDNNTDTEGGDAMKTLQLKEEDGSDIHHSLGSFNSASYASTCTQRGFGDTTLRQRRALHPPFSPVRFAILKRQCLALLHEGRSLAPLFSILDDVAAFCCANGHTLEAICIIPKEEINKMMMRRRGEGGGGGSGGHNKKDSTHKQHVVAAKGEDGQGSASEECAAQLGGARGVASASAGTTASSSSNRRAPPRRAGNTRGNSQNSSNANDAKNNKISASSSSPVGTDEARGGLTRPEAHVVRLGNGMLATVMLEVDLNEMDVEAEARRLREVQEVVTAMQEVRDLQQMIAIETQKQGDALALAEDKASGSAALAAKARRHLTKAAKHKVVFITLAGGLLGAAVGGPIGLVVGAKSAAAIVGASAIGGVSTAVATKIAASSASRVEIDPEYEDDLDREKERKKRNKGETAVERREKETRGTEARRLLAA